MLRIFKDLSELRNQRGITGVERLFVFSILFLRVFSLSYWIRTFLPDTQGSKRRIRDTFIEGYCLAQAGLLVILLLAPSHAASLFVTSYVLFELFLVLANTIFVGKFPTMQAPPASIERSILLLLLNIVEVVMIFAIFYRSALGLEILEALVQSSLVLGTVGYPEHLGGKARLLVPFQIFLDLTLSLLLLSSFVGQLGLFRSRTLTDLPKESDTGGIEADGGVP